MAEKNTLARPYAKAIFESATKDSEEAEWSERLQLVSLIAGDDLIKELISNPSVSGQNVADLFKQVAQDSTKKELDTKTNNLLSLLADNKRLNLLDEISHLYEGFIKKSKGVVEAEVVSAYSVSAAQQKTIAEALNKRLNQEIKITTSIDKSLVAGVIIRAGDLVIDGSITNQLKKITKDLAS